MFASVSRLSLLLGVLALPQMPEKAPGPAKGVFLVARDEIEGGPFWQSVVLVVSHGPEGTLGIIVNRATDVRLKDLLPALEQKESHTIQFGGPVSLDGLVFLFRADEPPEGATHVLEDVYFEGRLETLKRLLAEKSALKLFLGHAGWAPGQLEAELRRGSWDLVPADPFTLFGKDPATLWPELSGRTRTLARSRGLLSVFPTLRAEHLGGVGPRCNSLLNGRMRGSLPLWGRTPMSEMLTPAARRAKALLESSDCEFVS